MVSSREGHAVKKLFKRVDHQRNTKNICKKSDVKRLNCCQEIEE